jgi:hypothetical protein
MRKPVGRFRRNIEAPGTFELSKGDGSPWQPKDFAPRVRRRMFSMQDRKD